MDRTEKVAVVIIVLILSLIVIVTVVINTTNINLGGENDYQPKNVLQNCENFNGREFLLTGGSKVLKTNEDMLKESKRIQLLCRGGR